MYKNRKSKLSKSVKAESNKQLTRDVKKLEKKVSKIHVAMETKCAQYIVNNAPFYYLANIYFTMNGLSQGTSMSTRIGEKVRFTYLDFHMSFYNSNASGRSNGLVRVLIVREVPADGTSLTLLDLFNATTPNSPPVNSSYNFQTVDFPHRFKILHDQVFPTDVYNNVNKEIHIRKKLNFTTSYTRSNTGTIADIDKNSLTCVVITDWTANNNLYASFNYNLFYTDC